MKRGMLIRSQLANFSQFWSKFCHLWLWDQCKSSEKRFPCMGGWGLCCSGTVFQIHIYFLRIRPSVNHSPRWAEQMDIETWFKLILWVSDSNYCDSKHVRGSLEVLPLQEVSAHCVFFGLCFFPPDFWQSVRTIYFDWPYGLHSKSYIDEGEGWDFQGCQIFRE